MSTDINPPRNDAHESLLIGTDKEAAELAEQFKCSDPLEGIKPSLLSSEDIIEYVGKTGLVYPFYTRGGEKSRLKRASYEGRLGSKAYFYKPGQHAEIQEIEIPDPHGSLRVPANSIVFVECDLRFRLPNYIAIRYNLQIRHVHRGLLLGTGPLVDPGYWGCLCIPLHNLTSEDYVIPKNEGLIWVEFTKTSSLGGEGVDPLLRNTALVSSDNGDDVTKKGHWDARKFIERSAKSLIDDSIIPIRSSIPEAVAEASARAEIAIKNVRVLRSVGIAAALGVVVAIVVSVPAFLQSYNSIHQISKEYVDVSRAELQQLRDKQISDLVQSRDRLSQQLQQALRRDKEISDLVQSRDSLSQQLQQALRRIEQLESWMPPPASEKQGQQGEGAVERAQ